MGFSIYHSLPFEETLIPDIQQQSGSSQEGEFFSADEFSDGEEMEYIDSTSVPPAALAEKLAEVGRKKRKMTKKLMKEFIENEMDLALRQGAQHTESDDDEAFQETAQELLKEDGDYLAEKCKPPKLSRFSKYFRRSS